MKNFVSLLFISLLLFGCKKVNPVIYTISVENESGKPAYLEIDGNKHHFTDKEFTKEIKVEEEDYINVWAQVENSYNERIQMIFYIDGQYKDDISGLGYCSVFLKHSEVEKFNYGAGSGGNTESHYCGHPTQSGGSCRRLVSGSIGYCWQHR